MNKWFSAIIACILLTGLTAAAEDASPLKLVAKYKMPQTVQGHFDHFGVDLGGNRLFVTAERAHSVLVFDLRDGRLVHTLTGITIPHAILYREDINRIYITDGGEGDLKIFDGKTYRLLGTVPLKVDADSIGYDPDTHELYIDNGGGDAHESYSMFSIVNTNAGKKAGEIKIEGETLEAMALESARPRVYVNNAAKNQVEVIDRETRRATASWPVTLGKRNVAMALDEASHRLFVACRSGAIVVFNTETGKELQALPIAQGVDDLVFDPASRRLYAACGAGAGSVDVYGEEDPDHYKSLGQVPSGPGGRNAILVPQLHRYFVSVPPQGDTPGEVYVYQVQ